MAWGFSLVELVVAVGLAGFLTLLALAALGTQRRGASVLAARAEVLETARLVHVVLGEELRAGVSPRDQVGPQGDSLRVRAFRGLGLVCPGPAPDSLSLRVRYQGLRLPEPAKDSVLVLGLDLRWRAVGLESRVVETSSCGAALEPVELWRLSEPVGAAALARLFENGVYMLQARALRYRSGFGGRQPLSPELIIDERSALTGAPSGAVRLRLELRHPIPRGSPFATDATLWPRE